MTKQCFLDVKQSMFCSCYGSLCFGPRKRHKTVGFYNRVLRGPEKSAKRPTIGPRLTVRRPQPQAIGNDASVSGGRHLDRDQRHRCAEHASQQRGADLKRVSEQRFRHLRGSPQPPTCPPLRGRSSRHGVATRVRQRRAAVLPPQLRISPPQPRLPAPNEGWWCLSVSSARLSISDNSSDCLFRNRIILIVSLPQQSSSKFVSHAAVKTQSLLPSGYSQQSAKSMLPAGFSFTDARCICALCLSRAFCLFFAETFWSFVP